MSIIKDGSGNGYQAQVSDSNRLLVQSVTVEQLTESTESGDAFVCSSDFVTITDTTSFHGVFYLKNTSTDKDYHVYSIRTCGDSSTKWRLLKNPTSGTLISGGTSQECQNLSLGSSKTLTHTALSGGTSNTVTDGTLLSTHINSMGHSIQTFNGGLDLTPGTSIALTCKVGTNPTEVCTQIILFQKTEGII